MGLKQILIPGKRTDLSWISPADHTVCLYWCSFIMIFPSLIVLIQTFSWGNSLSFYGEPTEHPWTEDGVPLFLLLHPKSQRFLITMSCLWFLKAFISWISVMISVYPLPKLKFLLPVYFCIVAEVCRLHDESVLKFTPSFLKLHQCPIDCESCVCARFWNPILSAVISAFLCISVQHVGVLVLHGSVRVLLTALLKGGEASNMKWNHKALRSYKSRSGGLISLILFFINSGRQKCESAVCGELSHSKAACAPNDIQMMAEYRKKWWLFRL